MRWWQLRSRLVWLCDWPVETCETCSSAKGSFCTTGCLKWGSFSSKFLRSPENREDLCSTEEVPLTGETLKYQPAWNACIAQRVQTGLSYKRFNTLSWGCTCTFSPILYCNPPFPCTLCVLRSLQCCIPDSLREPQMGEMTKWHLCFDPADPVGLLEVRVVEKAPGRDNLVIGSCFSWKGSVSQAVCIK